MQHLVKKKKIWLLLALELALGDLYVGCGCLVRYDQVVELGGEVRTIPRVWILLCPPAGPELTVMLCQNADRRGGCM